MVDQDSVVFFGSGPVAAESLRLLHEHTTIEVVYTKPRPPHHRGTTPVLDLAESLGLTIITTTDKQELSQRIKEQKPASKLGIVIDYGIIIEQSVISAFPLGIINSHFSLLPQWRGADPISFAILSGQPETGVSLMLINDKLDEGNILTYGVEPIEDQPDATALTNRLILLSDALLKEAIPRHFMEQTNGVDQIEAAQAMGLSTEPTYSRKITKQDGHLDWTKPADQLEREIRAFIEWPKSRCNLSGTDVIITKAYAAGMSEPSTLQPGSTFLDDKQLAVACGQGMLYIERIKPSGKKDMPVSAFLAGYKL